MSVLAIDAGTTGVTALVVDEGGAVVARGYQEFPQHFPRPGWVEHEPEEIWQAVLGACRTEGLAVPQDLAVIGVDDLPAARLVVPALTTIAMDLSIPAGNLAAQVLALIEGGAPAALPVGGDVVELVQRGST